MSKPLAAFLFLLLAVLLLAATGSYGQTIQSVLNAASFTTAVAPGTWVAIFGTQLAPSAVAAQSAPFPTQLNGVTVTVAGIAAPLSYVSPTQINALIPFETATLNSLQSSRVPVVVTTPSGGSPQQFNITLTRSAPAVFTKNFSGTGDALTFDANFKPVSVVGTDPIVLYATGLGPTNPPAATGALGAGAEPLNRVVSPVSVSIGENAATVLYAGLAPGLHGIYQLNVKPNPTLGGRLFVSTDIYTSSSVTVPVVAGTNVANVIGTIDSLYPLTNSSIGFSTLLTAGTFNASFDIVAGAKPFVVYALSTSAFGISTVISIDPVKNTWQATGVVPTASERAWNFSGANFVVIDYLTSAPFPGNIIPQSRIDPAAQNAFQTIPLPNVASTGINGTWSASGSLPAGGHFSTTTVPGLSSFGGFTNFQIHSPGTNTSTLQLYVDNLLVASKSVTYSVQ